MKHVLYKSLHIINVRLIRPHIVPHPLNGLCNSFRKGILLLPFSQSLYFGVGAQKTVDLALFRAKPLLVADNPCLGINLADNFLGKLPNGNFLLGGDIDFLPNG